MEMMVGYVMGFLMAVAAWWISERREWAARRRVENKVDKIYENFACGKGCFDCDGGPDCKWDHK